MYKANIGDYPLLDYPCEYWWVRYATACTYLSKAHEQLWKPRLDQLKKKYHFDNYSYSGSFDNSNYTDVSNQKIWIYKRNKQTEITDQTSEIWKTIEMIITTEVHWNDCPYEQEHQSVCPFYKKSEFYADKSLEELRTHKGYEL